MRRRTFFLQLSFRCRKIPLERGIAHHCKHRYRSGGPAGGDSCAKRIAVDAANAACPLGYEPRFFAAPLGRGRPQYTFARSTSFSTSDSTRPKKASVIGKRDGLNCVPMESAKKKTLRCDAAFARANCEEFRVATSAATLSSSSRSSAEPTSGGGGSQTVRSICAGSK